MVCPRGRSDVPENTSQLPTVDRGPAVKATSPERGAGFFRVGSCLSSSVTVRTAASTHTVRIATADLLRSLYPDADGKSLVGFRRRPAGESGSPAFNSWLAVAAEQARPSLAAASAAASRSWIIAVSSVPHACAQAMAWSLPGRARPLSHRLTDARDERVRWASSAVLRLALPRPWRSSATKAARSGGRSLGRSERGPGRRRRLAPLSTGLPHICA